MSFFLGSTKRNPREEAKYKREVGRVTFRPMEVFIDKRLTSITIDEDELTHYFTQEHQEFLFQIRKMFDKADRDGDGKLTKEEWYKVLNSSGCNTSMLLINSLGNILINICLGMRSLIFLRGWTVTLMVVCPLESSWVRKLLWRRSLRAWTR